MGDPVLSVITPFTVVPADSWAAAERTTVNNTLIKQIALKSGGMNLNALFIIAVSRIRNVVKKYRNQAEVIGIRTK
jgi:hypothetical protein